MLKKLLLACLIAIAGSMAVVQTASAHFSIEDDTAGIKTQFHVTPDHQPIAGKSSIISFDFSKGKTSASDYRHELTVTSNRTKPTVLATSQEGNVLLANYIFPSQGLYTIKLRATAERGGKVSEFSYSQRVSKGVVKRESALTPLQLGVIGGTLFMTLIAVVLTARGDMIRKRRT